MPRYLKESELREQALSTANLYETKNFITKYKFEATKTIFLSHSHQDRDLAKGLVSLLDKLGIKLYVDWQDSNMPRVTSRKTAEEIKKKICELDFFLILATNAALKSKWVPWETGVADQCKTASRMAIIPVADNTGTFEGSEYLQLYDRIQWNDQGSVALFETSYTYTSKGLREWLQS